MMHVNHSSSSSQYTSRQLPGLVRVESVVVAVVVAASRATASVAADVGAAVVVVVSGS